MRTRTIQLITLAAALALSAAAGLSLVSIAGDDGGQSPGITGHLHRLGERIHGAGDGGHGHAHGQVAGVLEQLDLTPAQQLRVRRIHELMAPRAGSGPAGMQALHEKLVAQYEQGDLDTDELHALIDEHLEQMRAMFHGVTDEMVGLLNDLDATQRETLMTHLRQSGGLHRLGNAH